MKPTPQTRPHPNGDCVRACLASLLELNIDLVPDFALMSEEENPDGYPVWYQALQDWLSQFGLQFVEIQLDRKTWFPLPHDMFAILIGPHASGSRHAIIGKCEGGKFFPVYDPLEGETLPFDGGKIEAVCFLIGRDPMLQVKMGKALENIAEMSRGVSNRIIGQSIEQEANEALCIPGVRMNIEKIEKPLILAPNGKPA